MCRVLNARIVGKAPAPDRDGSREDVIAKHRAWLASQPELLNALDELRGRDLVCWCAPQACHGDVLIEFANRP